MYPRTNYEMTQAQLDKILEACKPTPVMYLSGGAPMFDGPQENANRAWAALGEEMGFDYTTVMPQQGASRGPRFFSAIPSEPDEVRQERLQREDTARRQQEIEETEAEIRRLNTKLERLTK